MKQRTARTRPSAGLRLLSWFFAFALIHATLRAGDTPRLTAKEAGQFTLAAAIIEKSVGFTIAEGLPHQLAEADSLKKELASAETQQIHGFPFYAQLLKPSAPDERALRELATDLKSFRPYSGPKRCGGFHPDYALSWKSGNATAHLLVCFGCREIRFHAPGVEMTLDVADDAFATLQQTLEKYRKHRPLRG